MSIRKKRFIEASALVLLVLCFVSLVLEARAQSGVQDRRSGF